MSNLTLPVAGDLGASKRGLAHACLAPHVDCVHVPTNALEAGRTVTVGKDAVAAA